MKNLTLAILLTLFSSVLITAQSDSRNEPKTGEIPYKTYNVKFVLDSETPEQVGFNDPKSYWQFSYELRFLEKDFEFRYFKEKENESRKEREKRIRKNNKQHDRGWKKNGILVFRGKSPKMPINAASNRELTIPVSLPPKITEILAKAENTWANPDFRVSMRGKAYLIDSSGKKIKHDLSIAFVCPTKTRTEKAQYWMINSCGISHEIRKTNDGRIIVGWKSRI